MVVRDSQYALFDKRLMDQFDYLASGIKNRFIGNPTLAIGTVSKKEIKFSTAVYLNDGVFYSLTGAEVAFTATTHDITANATSVQEAVYLLSVDSAGTVTVTMGDVSTGAGTALIPEVPSGDTPMGYLRLAVAAGSTDFNATTDDLDAAHLTDTYVSLGYLQQNFTGAQ